MIRLIADTSPSGFRLGFFENEKLLWEKYLLKAKGEQATDLVQQALDDLGLKAQNVSEVLLTNGPGSFTGIRTLIAFMSGFCYGSGAILRMASSLKMRGLVAQKMLNLDCGVSVVMNAGAGGCYVGAGLLEGEGWLERRFELTELEKLEPPVVAFAKVSDRFSNKVDLELEKLEENLLQGFVELEKSFKECDLNDLQVNYIQAPNVTISKK
jgi:tRNA A37 threonylcarbamoyladenosine modification protein TsaB